MRDKLRQFILTEFDLKLSESLLTDDFRLLETETIDSLAIFTLVHFLETDFGVEVTEADLVIDNFTSIAAMAKMVEVKLAGSQGL